MNPFSYGTIVKGQYFYDRHDECKRIVTTISGGNNLVLFAPGRFGKTSLVFRAIEDLENLGFTCIYFDFMPVYSRESFIEAYSKAILGLVDSGIVEKFEGTYFIGDPFFKRFLSHYA